MMQPSSSFYMRTALKPFGFFLKDGHCEWTIDMNHSCSWLGMALRFILVLCTMYTQVENQVEGRESFRSRRVETVETKYNIYSSCTFKSQAHSTAEVVKVTEMLSMTQSFPYCSFIARWSTICFVSEDMKLLLNARIYFGVENYYFRDDLNNVTKKHPIFTY